MSKILIFVETGLGTDVYGSDDCGMLTFAEELSGTVFLEHEVDISRNGWDQNPPPRYNGKLYTPDALGQWQWKLDYILETKPDAILCLGHSLGGWETIGFLRFLANFGVEVFATVLFDPVKNPLVKRLAGIPWDVSPAYAPCIYVPYQTRGAVLCIVGTPLPAPAGSNRINELHNEYTHIPTAWAQGITYARPILAKASAIIATEFAKLSPGEAPAPAPVGVAPPAPAPAWSTGASPSSITVFNYHIGKASAHPIEDWCDAMAAKPTPPIWTPAQAPVIADLQARLAKLEASVFPPPAPVIPTLDPATYAIDWSKIDARPWGRFCRFVKNGEGVDLIDPNDFGLLLARWQSACDAVKAGGGGTIVIWDAVSIGYNSNFFQSNIPAATVAAMATYAKSRGLAWGILLCNNFLTHDGNGWHDDNATAYTADLIAVARAHRDTWGATAFYCDSNNASDPLRSRKVVTALAQDALAGAPACVFNVENTWKPANNANNTINDFGKVASAWYDPQNSWLAPDANFPGRVLIYISHWANMNPSDKAAFVAWAKANPAHVQYIADCWNGFDPVPPELKGN